MHQSHLYLTQQTTKPNHTLRAGLPRPEKGKKHATKMVTAAYLKMYDEPEYLAVKVSFSDPQFPFIRSESQSGILSLTRSEIVLTTSD